MAWFGPKGIATMAFSLLVLSSGIDEAETIFNIAALAVVTSVFAHGSTEGMGVAWIYRHSQREVALPKAQE
jgi:NhaP-type Na+/H+ or K+/H+ antiporter